MNGGPNPTSRARRAWLIVKVIELRLRFVAILVATGLAFAYADTIRNWYETRNRPPALASATAGPEFFCPMHPEVVQAEPGKCPICAMPLSKRTPGERPTLKPGTTARVELSPQRIAQGRIQTLAVGYAPVRASIATVGTVAIDERRTARIAQKIKGSARIDQLYVNFTGDQVRAGQKLADLYSPELDQAVQELLLARRSGQAVLAASAARRLRLWGIDQAQIDSIVAAGKPIDRLAVLAPIAGVVIRKEVVQGQYVAEGEPLFEVADLGRVWIRAQVYEDQLGRVRVGQRVDATVASFPGETFSGTVAFLDPVLDPATRTVGVRLDLENPDLRLRPGMYASVTIDVAPEPTKPGPMTAQQQRICPVTNMELGSMGPALAVQVQGQKVWICCEGCESSLQADPKKFLARLTTPAPAGQALSVPESAVIDTGTRKIVYVEAEPGVFEGREVELGPAEGGVYPVFGGIAAGEKVAASGAFLIDAETRLNPGLSATYTGSRPDHD